MLSQARLEADSRVAAARVAAEVAIKGERENEDVALRRLREEAEARKLQAVCVRCGDAPGAAAVCG